MNHQRPRERDRSENLNRSRHRSNPHEHSSRHNNGMIMPRDRPHQQSYNQEIPPKYRRTLILSNVPPSMTFHNIRHHFCNRMLQVDFCTIDRSTGDAYVKFRERSDVMRLWEGGDAALDGDGAGDHDHGGVSLVKAGVKIKAIHWTNQVPQLKQSEEEGSRGSHTQQQDPPRDRSSWGQQQPFDRKRSWDDNGTNSNARKPNGSEWGGRGHGLDERRAMGNQNYSQPNYTNNAGRGGGGRGDLNANNLSNKMPRRDNSFNYATPNSDQTDHHFNHSVQQPVLSFSDNQHHSSVSSQLHSSQEQYLKTSLPTAPNSNNGSFTKNQATPTKSIQIHPKQQLSTPPTAWRRHNAHNNNNSQQLSSQISTLQQKLSLLHQQETTLQKQVTLQKKMLELLKSKNSSKDDQSKKLKEILTAQTRVMELKKERMEGLQQLDGLKQQMNIVEKKNTWGKKSLDRRTTTLRVHGLNTHEVVDESLKGSIKEHFSAFGSVTNVSLESETSSDEESKITFALVTFATRADAERAKLSGAEFNDATLTCEWHNLPPSVELAVDPKKIETGHEKTNTNEKSGDPFHSDIYDDVYEQEVGSKKHTSEEGDSDTYQEEQEEHMVDYD